MRLDSRSIQPSQKKQDYIPFVGGLDQITPHYNARPGTLRICHNWEIDNINGGYKGVDGYEIYDGQASPSDANYYILTVTISGEFSVNDTITGAVSGDTAVVVAVVTSTTPNYLVVTKVVGEFGSAEDLEVSAVVEGTLITATLNGASTALLHAQYKALAADNYRTDIGTTTVVGDVIGIFLLNDVTYAFIENGGSVFLNKETASGFALVALGRELSFTSGGTTEITEGQTITGATSSATAVLTRVVLESGSWAGGDAAGRFIFASQTGTFQSENINVGASTNLATIAGDSTAISLTGDTTGHFETVRHNFGGEAGTERIYGCDGVNRGFEFDGTVFVPIATGMTTDTPLHVYVHRNHLFFSFAGSAQHSGIATPYIWSPIFGAAELAVGDNITAFKRQPGTGGEGALVIYCRNRVNVLYGTSSADWILVPYREETGAFAYSVQDIGMLLGLDDFGVVNFQTTQKYGNFSHSVISSLVRPFLESKGNTLTASCIVRKKNQYRLFFSDKTALYVTMNGNKVAGMMTVQLDHLVKCIYSEELSDGTEQIMFGSEGGEVFQMEKGTSFDGALIENYIFLHSVHSNSPGVSKKYIEATVYMTGSGYGLYQFDHENDYAREIAESPLATSSRIPMDAIHGEWSSADWDKEIGTNVRVDLEGDGESIGFIIGSSNNYTTPGTFSGILFNYLQRPVKNRIETGIAEYGSFTADQD